MKFQIAALAFAAGAMATYDIPTYGGHSAPPTYGSKPAGEHSKPAHNATLTTSTVWQTVESTIIQCPASVTNCPAESKTAVVVTDTVALYTTICPVEQASSTPVVVVPITTSQAPVTVVPITTAEATNAPPSPGVSQVYPTESPCPTAGAAESTVGTITYAPTTPVETTAPIATGAAGRAGPAFGGLAVAAAVAMML